MDFLTSTFVIGAIISITLLVVGKLLPNEKVYGFGFGLGQWLDKIATLKLGANWQKIENFIINSGGVFFSGFRDGLIGEVQPEKNRRY